MNFASTTEAKKTTEELILTLLMFFNILATF